MTTTCYNLSGKLPPDRLDLLVRFQEAATGLGQPFLLVGATVRDLILTEHFGIPVRRATRDLDFAVMLPDWAGHERLAVALERQGFSRNLKKPHEFRLNGDWIDIIPFGPVSRSNTIAWPPEQADVMNVIGYEEVFDHAVDLQLGPELTIKSASLPGYALLKLFAWNDRPQERGKDLDDIWLMLQNYYVAGEVENRLFPYHADLVALYTESFRDRVGARVLGRDVARLCGTQTLSALLELLDRETGDDSKLVNGLWIKAGTRELDADGELYGCVASQWQAFVAGCKDIS